jgi:hypothetical protein
MGGQGYQFWSGIGSDLGEIAIIAAVFAFWRRHNCHVNGCWRLAWHPSDDHGGHTVCRHHHPHAKAVTASGLDPSGTASKGSP